VSAERIWLKGNKMKKELRQFPRIRANIKVSYEFVKWNEYKLNVIERPNYTKIHDISVGGIGLSELPDINQKVLKKLEKGRRKIRLAIFLYRNKPPLITFARIIWSSAINDNNIKRYGFVFINVSPHFYLEMMKFVNYHLKKTV
jgi:hypothetical protein